MKRFIVLVPILVLAIGLLNALSLSAQNRSATTRASQTETDCSEDASRAEHVEGCYPDLQKYLNLTAHQIRNLAAIQQRQLDAEAPIYEQISEKRDAAHELLHSGSADANKIGQLLIDAQQLEARLSLDGSHRAEALNELTPDQKNKLGTLANALKLQNAAAQAATLNLVDDPNADLNDPYWWSDADSFADGAGSRKDARRLALLTGPRGL